jgi:hypothetical protein
MSVCGLRARTYHDGPRAVRDSQCRRVGGKARIYFSLPAHSDVLRAPDGARSDSWAVSPFLVALR